MNEYREASRAEPHIALYRNAIAAAYMELGEYENAIQELLQALALEPRYGAARERLIRCYERLGRYDEAVGERRGAPNAATAERFAVALRESGDAGYRSAREIELREMMATIASGLDQDEPQTAADILNPPQLRLALACAELGEWDRAREWEEHACSRRSGQRQWFIAQRGLLPIHGDARPRPRDERRA